MTLALPTDPVRSALMKRVRRHRTHAEDVVAAALRAHHIGYRRNVKALPGSPDFANKSKRWAIFVNGCFWHHHKGCKRATIPTRNRAFWLAKFAANRGRDAKKIKALRALGFHVAVIWECEALDQADNRNERADTRERPCTIKVVTLAIRGTALGQPCPDRTIPHRQQ
jgi:DNA mismatch endonuclease (patch repair protein)